MAEALLEQKINRYALMDVDHKDITIQELVEAIPQVMMERYDVVVLKFKIRISYDSHVSNGHQCPLSGVTNWGMGLENREKLPTGYPGFKGRFTIKFFAKGNERDASFGYFFNRSNPRAIAGFYSGSGGGGGDTTYIHLDTGAQLKSYNLSYDCQMFLDDFPHLKENIINHERYCKLKYGSDTQKFRDAFYGDIIDVGYEYNNPDYRVM